LKCHELKWCEAVWFGRPALHTHRPIAH
jgi:hypothetical protein